METRRGHSTVVLVVMALAAGFGAGYGLNPAAVTAKQTDPPGLSQRVDRLEAVVTQLETKLGCVQTMGTFDVIFEGCNVHIRNAMGETATQNGLGNLIIGYNEPDSDGHPGRVRRTGSHNLVVGSRHEYTSYGGLVAGLENALTERYASVVGGTGNLASGLGSSVSGGASNVASGTWSTVSGGEGNTAAGIAELYPW